MFNTVQQAIPIIFCNNHKKLLQLMVTWRRFHVEQNNAPGTTESTATTETLDPPEIDDTETEAAIKEMKN